MCSHTACQSFSVAVALVVILLLSLQRRLDDLEHVFHVRRARVPPNVRPLRGGSRRFRRRSIIDRRVFIARKQRRRGAVYGVQRARDVAIDVLERRRVRRRRGRRLARRHRCRATSFGSFSHHR